MLKVSCVGVLEHWKRIETKKQTHWKLKVSAIHWPNDHTLKVWPQLMQINEIQ